jgi:hypothetical protein
MERLRAVMIAAADVLKGSAIPAMAIVFAMPDGTLTAGIVGDVTERQALATLLDAGPEVLRLTVIRFATGEGNTTVVPR